MEIKRVAGLIVMLKFADEVAGVPCESATCTVKLAVAAVVGIPDIVPLDVRVNPAGKEPELILHVYGVTPPEAWRICE